MGEVASFLREPEMLKEGFLLFQVNHACQAIYSEMREAWGEKHLVQETANLVADQYAYNLPATCEDVRKLERQWDDDPVTWVPVNRVPFAMRDKLLFSPQAFPEYEGLSYVLVPGGAQIELTETPPDAVTNGLRFTFYPKWVEILAAGLAGYPDTIPTALHEAIIARALERVIPRNGGQVVNEKAAWQFIADSRETTKRFLYPADSERAPEIDVENELYSSPYFP